MSVVLVITVMTRQRYEKRLKRQWLKAPFLDELPVFFDEVMIFRPMVAPNIANISKTTKFFG